MYYLPSLKHLLKLALPLSGAMLSQALINLVDSALVGNLGGLALASVAIGSYMIFVLVALPVGLATGITILLSQQAHQQQAHQQQAHQQQAPTYQHYLSTSCWLMLIISLGLVILGYYASPWFITHFVIDDRMTGVAQAYFDWRLWALPGIALSLLCRSYWISQQQPWHYTRILIVTHLLNVPISYGLIYGVGGLTTPMGAAGAGVGTCVSIYIGLILQWLHWQGYRVSEPSQQQKYTPKPLVHLRLILALYGRKLLSTGYKKCFKDIIRIAAPSGLNQLGFALYMAVLFWLISHLGATNLAVSFAVFNVGLMMVLPFIGLGQAVASLIKRNTKDPHHLGNNPLANNKQWIRLAVMTGLGIGLINLVVVWWFGENLFKLLFNNTTLITLAATGLPIYALALLMESINQVLSRSLIAYRYATSAALINLGSNWLVIIPLSTYGLIYLNSYAAIWWVQLIGKAILAAGLWLLWMQCLSAERKKLAGG